MFIATLLTIDQFYLSGMILVHYTVFKDEIALGADNNISLRFLPHATWAYLISLQISGRCVMAERLAMLGKVRQCLVHLTDHQKLTIICAFDYASHPASLSWNCCFALSA